MVLSQGRSQDLGRLRYFLGAILALLYLQFELGMDTNLANPPSLPPIEFSIPQVFSNLSMIGPEAVIHAVNGLVIFSLALTITFLSLRTRVRSIKILGAAAPLAIAFAMLSGLTFVLSGFQNSGGSYGMAHGFIATFTVYTAELYLVAKWFRRTLPTAVG